MLGVKKSSIQYGLRVSLEQFVERGERKLPLGCLIPGDIHEPLFCPVRLTFSRNRYSV